MPARSSGPVLALVVAGESQARRKEKPAITEMKRRFQQGKIRFTDNENVHVHTTLVSQGPVCRIAENLGFGVVFQSVGSNCGRRAGHPSGR